MTLSFCWYACSGNVPGMSQNVPGMSRECPGNVPACPGNVPEMSRKCPGNVPEMSRKCPPNVPRMSPECPGNVLKFSSERLSARCALCAALGRYALCALLEPLRFMRCVWRSAMVLRRSTAARYARYAVCSACNAAFRTLRKKNQALRRYFTRNAP